MPTIIPTGEPVSTAIVSVIATVLGSLFGLFRGRVDKELAKALNALRNVVNTGFAAITYFALRLARTIGKILEAVHSLWVRIIQPVFDAIARAARRINEIVDKVLKPYLDLLKRIREIIDLIYNVIFRPIIQTLETVRKILVIGRLLRIKAAARADRAIAGLEAKILEPLFVLYRKVNESLGWLNVLVTARATIQGAVLLASLDEHKGAVVNLIYNAQSQPLDDEGLRRISDVQSEAAPGVAESEFRQLVSTRSGPAADGLAEGITEMRASFGRRLAA